MKGLGPIFLISILLVAIAVEALKPRYPPKKDGCYACHNLVRSTDPSHDLEAFGCSVCHLGNPHALNQRAAHIGMVKNPADLRLADRTCGRPGCHPELVNKVSNSIMATGAGMLYRLKWVIGEMGLDLNEFPQDILEAIRTKKDIPLLDYFGKMCGGCHLWKEVSKEEGEIGERGGGCSACHVLRVQSSKDFGTKSPYRHSQLTTKIPSTNCIRCHNRSARIGLSYKGIYESEGYGTPYEGAQLSSRRLSGNRFYLELSPDIHHRKAGLECIDCHNGQELMGDGKKYRLLKEQLDTACLTCHAPNRDQNGNIKEDYPDERALKLSKANREIELKQDSIIRYSQRGYPLYNIVRYKDEFYLFRKSDGHPFKITMMVDAPYHTLKGHERLSCQSCHSSWMPQCYGCHIRNREGLQWDWLKKEASLPQWVERRDFMRFESPKLGLKEGKIYPISPHYVSYYGEGGELYHYHGLASFDPHTTQRSSRSCSDCHRNPMTYGVGGPYPSLDRLVGKNGLDAEALKDKDLDRILKVGLCIGCHMEYGDKIYQDFQKSLKRFFEEDSLPCRR